MCNDCTGNNVKLDIKKPKNLDRYLKTISQRAHAFKKAATKEAATAFKKAVEEKANRTGQDYAKDIHLRKVQGNMHTLVVMVDEQAVNLEDTQPTDVFIYEPVARVMKQSPISSILKKHGPYPRALLPYRVDRRYFKLTFKTVTPKEFETIRARVQDRFKAIVGQLEKAGALPAQLLLPGQADPGLQVVEDLVFRTVRRELGMRTKRQPVWIPSMREFINGNLKFLTDERLGQILGDISYTGWANLGAIGENEPSDIIKKVEKFQEKLLAKV